MNNLPFYYENVTGGKPLKVSVSRGSEIWTNASGDTLFSRIESDGSQSVSLSLPASENGYIPKFSFSRYNDDQTFSFEIAASVLRDPSAVSADSVSGEESEYDAYGYDEYGYTEYEDDEDDLGWGSIDSDAPDVMLDFLASGSGLPHMLPADSDFSLSVSVVGALYPDYAFIMNGTTNRDGAVTLSLSKPLSNGDAQTEIFSCTGTFIPAADPKDVPNYMQETLGDIFNAFSFNEQKLANFKSRGQERFLFRGGSPDVRMSEFSGRPDRHRPAGYASGIIIHILFVSSRRSRATGKPWSRHKTRKRA